MILDLRSSRPKVAMSILSISMLPSTASMMRNIARVSDDLPAPVRPTTPTLRDTKYNIVLVHNTPVLLVHNTSVVHLLYTCLYNHSIARLYLCSTRNVNRYVLECHIKILSIASGVVIKLHTTFKRPVIRWPTIIYDCWSLSGNL